MRSDCGRAHEHARSMTKGAPRVRPGGGAGRPQRDARRAPIKPLLKNGSDLVDVMVHSAFVGDGRPGTHGNRRRFQTWLLFTEAAHALHTNHLANTGASRCRHAASAWTSVDVVHQRCCVPNRRGGVRVSERRARLRGLDEPVVTKSQLTGSLSVTAAEMQLKAQCDELLRRREAC
jgi:hypothetical protein